MDPQVVTKLSSLGKLPDPIADTPIASSSEMLSDNIKNKPSNEPSNEPSKDSDHSLDSQHEIVHENDSHDLENIHTNEQVQTSFDRNFDISDTQVDKTVDNANGLESNPIPINNDDFSFAQPPSDLSNQKDFNSHKDYPDITPDDESGELDIGDEQSELVVEAIEPATETIQLSSPNKSIMKKTPTNSPKKNVVFTTSVPEVIHYSEQHRDGDYDDGDYAEHEEFNNPHTIEEDEGFSDKIEQTLNHHWNQVRKTSVSSDDATPPPAPPPHGVDLNSLNFHETNNPDDHDYDHKQIHDSDNEQDLDDLSKQDVDKDTLHTFKLHLKNLNNISLNEKLDIFLNKSNDQYQDDTMESQDRNSRINDTGELDQHLQELGEASNSRVESNIHHLSLDLQNKLTGKIENPLNSLSKSTEVHLKSGGSSQSSLQSLMDTNRMLQSSQNNDPYRGSKGVELNDGIHGFSNDVVEQLIPQQQQYHPSGLDNSDESQILTMKSSNDPKRLSRQSLLSENDEFHDSFDTEYNNTEQSIMNLLSSASKNDLHDDYQPSGTQLPTHTNPALIPADDQEKNPIVKEEPGNFDDLNTPHDPIVKKSPSIEEMSVKNEIKSEISDDIRNQDTQDSSVSQEREIQKPILKDPVSGEDLNDHEEEEIEQQEPEQEPAKQDDLKQDSQQDSQFDNSQESVFNIRDQVDDAWKFEDSNDADREDNDVTYNDVTVASQHEPVDGTRLESMIPKLESKSLEVNLSPNSSQSFEESPDRKSLAPPRSETSLSNSPTKSLAPPRGASVDIGIDATTPPTPIRKAREERLRLNSYESQSQSESPIPMNSSNSTPSMEERPLSKITKSPGGIIDDEETLIHHQSVTSPKVQPASVHQNNQDHFHDNQETEEEEFNVLANSSNVAPPDEITLPPIEGNNYSSFEELTRQLNTSRDNSKDIPNAFEQSVSAEFDEEKPVKATDFLSIWHSQSRHKKHYPTHLSGKSFDASNITVYDPKSNTFKLPNSAVNKKFTDVKLNSRKVVDPEHEDLDVQNFLPDLSEDSGFGNPFNHSIGLSRNDSVLYENKENNGTSEPHHHPPVFDDGNQMNKKTTPIEINNNNGTESKVPYPKTLKPQPLPKGKINELAQKRKSRFRVPSAEIQQSIARFANKNNGPTNQYDDIFHDTQDLEQEAAPPTIKGEGMKTLPSMDREDVQKILNTKRFISQEEYSQLKMVGKKSSVIHDNSQQYDILQQRASIYHADNSMESSALIDVNKNLGEANKNELPEEVNKNENTNNNEEINKNEEVKSDKEEDNSKPNDNFPHIANELMKNPTALLSKDQVFNDSDLYSSQPTSRNPSRINSAIQKDINVGQYFPDPDPELVNSPVGNVFRISPRDNVPPKTDTNFTPRVLELNKENILPSHHESSNSQSTTTTGRPRSPIKIGSPIKLVKRGSDGGSVIAVSPEKKKPSDSKLDSVTDTRIASEPGSEVSASNGSKVMANGGLADKNPSEKEVEVQTNMNAGSGSTPIENDSKSYFGKEITNTKLRGNKANEENQLDDVHQKKPSMVSVPSMYTENSNATENVTDPSRASSQTLLNINNNRVGHTWKQNSVQESVIRENDNALPLERGRLFFRVVGLKNINLPDLPDHNGEFSVTLDNGVHCIKTPNYKVEDHRVLIGKEFELTVGDSLEFILTMKMNYEKPRGKLVEVKERKLVKSKNKFGRIFGSKDVITTTKFVPQDPIDSWDGKFAQDGSFGRCYIDLEQYESKTTYKSASFDIPVFNEWETIKTRTETIKAKPYVIGQLEVKMLFVPRTELHESLPTSIKTANDIINELTGEQNLRYEGYLTQDGGDCDGLKRRYFKLIGSSLIAHSEFSHKTRAKINLTKVIDVIYVDRGRPETTKKARNFSDVLLVPDSFKIKFANGEIIDLGAPNAHEKANWVMILETITQHNRYRRLPWVKAMLSSVGNNSNNPWYNKETNQFQ